MDKEQLRKRLEQEGFMHIYEWKDEAGTTYSPHAHKGAVAMYILEGRVTFHFDDKTTELQKGDRFDVPVGKEHGAVVGPAGCKYLVGEMIEGDT